MLGRLLIAVALLLFLKTQTKGGKKTFCNAVRRSSTIKSRSSTIEQFATFYLVPGEQMLSFEWLIFLHSSQSGWLVSHARETATMRLK